MRLEPAQQVISAQIWVCDTCGSQDHKSCGCNSTAHMEEKLKKAWAQKEADRRYREKLKENQRPHDNSAVIDFPNKFQPDAAASDGPELEPDPVRAHSAFLIRADFAARAAFYMRGKIDPEIIAAAEDTAAVWARLVSSLKEGKHIEVEE